MGVVFDLTRCRSNVVDLEVVRGVAPMLELVAACFVPFAFEVSAAHWLLGRVEHGEPDLLSAGNVDSGRSGRHRFGRQAEPTTAYEYRIWLGPGSWRG